MGRSQINAAFKAMKEIGIPEKKTKRALIKLLNLFDKKWDLIVAENYRLLADTIFEDEDAEPEAAEEEQQKKSGNADQAKVSEEDAQLQDEAERPQKRLRLKHQKPDAPSHSQQSHIYAPFALKTPKTEPGEPEAFQLHVENKGKQLVSLPEISQRTRSEPEQASQTLQIKEQEASGTSKEMQPNFTVMKPNDEPFTDDMLSLTPLAVVLPDEIHQEVPAISGNPVGSQAEFMHQKSSSETANQVSSLDFQGSIASKSLVGIESGASESADAVDRSLGTLTLSSVDADQIQEIEVSKRILAIDITASGLEEVKLSLSYNPGLEGKDIYFPDLPEVLKKFDDTCLKKYEIADLKFSVMKIFKEFCNHVGELGTHTDGASQDRCDQENAKVIDSKGNCCLQSKGCLNLEISDYVAATADPETISDASNLLLASKFALEYEQFEKDAAVGSSAERDSSAVNETSLVLGLPQKINPIVNCLHDPNVIVRGVEGVTISLDQTNCDSLPFFHYISQNVISRNARVNFSFAQIGNKDSCSSCSGDCLDLSLSCCCAYQNEGESSYTSDGLLRKDFLDMCVAMVRNRQKDCFVYCKECPLERLKNEDIPDPCKGHLKRKFIKECWLKCGCSKNCGNRVIQHGISRNLQVFWTPEGKGWGLRTLEDLPKGAFVCEYVGEILTCTELHDRNLKSSNGKHLYAVLLDTDWATKALKETEILCLDSTFYGNVARFINHRCLDANLIEIPVEVETPSHHYYHVALFTTRDINALEELTWDYGIDFDDGESYYKTFRCLCGSNFCRHMNRSSRSRSIITLQ